MGGGEQGPLSLVTAVAPELWPVLAHGRPLAVARCLNE